jgi:iron complex outermembrane receptor protein
MRPTPKVYLDLSFFYNVYRDILGTTELPTHFETEPTPAHLVMPRQFVNDTAGRTQGLELASTWQASDSARVSLGYSFLEMDVLAPDGYDNTGNSPRHQVNARVFYDLSKTLHFDTMFYYVDELFPQNRTKHVDPYSRVDFRFAWDASRQLELVVGIRNAFDSQHPEFSSIPFIVATELDRSFYGKLSYRF